MSNIAGVSQTALRNTATSVRHNRHPVDVAVGGRVRELRIRAGLTQVELGEALGVSFQQIQKYEKGANRMGASRLVQVATTLKVPLASLFEGVDEPGQPGGEVALGPLNGAAAKVARDWARIEHPSAREALRITIHQLAVAENRPAAPPVAAE